MATQPTTRPVLEDVAADRDVETSGLSPLAPVVEGERLSSVDVLRGVAVLGILLMNIVGMGLPSFAYLDPTYAGGSTGADGWSRSRTPTWARSRKAGSPRPRRSCWAPHL